MGRVGEQYGYMRLSSYYVEKRPCAFKKALTEITQNCALGIVSTRNALEKEKSVDILLKYTF